MFSKELADKIDKFLHENLEIMFEFEFNGLLLLYGGALRGYIMDIPIKDYDFFVLTQEEANLLEFLKKYNINYEKNYNHGYKFTYNNLKVGLNSTNDLYNVCGYNTDFLFYDIHRKQFIPIGIKNAVEKRKIIIYEYYGYPSYECRMALKNRLKKHKEYIQFLSNDEKPVRVIKKNKYYRRLFIGFLKNPSKIKKIFSRRKHDVW